MLKEYNCKICGSLFSAHSYYEKRPNGNSYCSKECRYKSMFGRTNKSRTGQKHTKETLAKMKISSPKSESHYKWKGDDIGYGALHRWVEKMLGKAKEHICVICNGNSGSKRMEWANINGTYKRELIGWKPMCRKCHIQYDKENLGIKIGRQRSLVNEEVIEGTQSKWVSIRNRRKG